VLVHARRDLIAAVRDIGELALDLDTMRPALESAGLKYID
jgi:hypothetical protein